ncbi:hypothetical protein GCM10009021_25480 [Halarchaeum nitratireducens]|uniref:Uncharacterized protein n=2 Tax=Halarchaeum nitratireducens TaxID=489913 RepID=A0A830GCZ7_9EURY|nr:hypothetical protein GCM10009021_25480 [Halarchaeum nitratireducens]
MALSSDQERSGSNTIQVRTVEFSMASSGGGVVDGSNGSLRPGASTSGNVTISNLGDLDGTADLNVTYTERDANGSTADGTDISADETAKLLDITTLQYGGLSIIKYINDRDGDGTKTLYDLAQSEVNLGTLDASESQRFSVTLTVNESSENTFRNDGLNATFNVTVTQTY